MGTVLGIGQQWEHNSTSIRAEVLGFDFYNVDLKYLTNPQTRFTLNKSALARNWSVVRDEIKTEPVKLEVNDTYKTRNGKITILWVKEDGSAALVRRGSTEWVASLSDFRFWTKIVPEVLPVNTSRIATRNSDGTGEDIIRYVDDVFGATNTFDIVTSASAGVLLVNMAANPSAAGTFLSTELLEFILAERKKYENEAN